MSLDIKKLRNEWREYIHSEKAKSDFKEWSAKYDIEESKSERFKQRYLERIKQIDNLSKDSFNQFVQKVVAKYNSDKYIDYWCSQYLSCPESLLNYIFDYVVTVGRESTKQEDRDFRIADYASLYYYKLMYFEQLYGQGESFIKVYQIKQL